VPNRSNGTYSKRYNTAQQTLSHVAMHDPSVYKGQQSACKTNNQTLGVKEKIKNDKIQAMHCQQGKAISAGN